MGKDDLGVDPLRHTPRRRNKEIRAAVERVAAGEDSGLEPHEKPWRKPNEKWHDVVKLVFQSVAEDEVMRQFMTPMSWALLYMKCEAWSREFKPKFLAFSEEGVPLIDEGTIPGAVLADMSKTLNDMGATEAARRSMKILINPSGEGESGNPVEIEANKKIVRPTRRKAIGGGG